MSNRATSYVVASGMASMNTGQTIIFSLLPLICLSIGLTGQHAGIILSISAFVFALVSPIWGQVSERFGRVPVLALGLFGYSAGTLLFIILLELEGSLNITLISFFILMILTRCLQSTLMGAIIPASSAYMIQTHPPDERAKAMALLGGAQNIGAILGPLLITFFADFSLLAPLYVATVFSGLSCIAVFLFADREKTAGRDDVELHPWVLTKEIFLSFIDPRYRSLIVLGIGIFVTFSMVQQPLGPWLAQAYNLDHNQAANMLGQAMMAFAISGTFIQLWVIPRLSLEPAQYLLPGFVLIALCGASLPFWHHVWVLYIALGSMGIGLSICFVGYAGELNNRVGDLERGKVGGVIGATPAFGLSIGPVLGGTLFEVNSSLPFYVSMFIAVFLAGWSWRTALPKE